MCDSVALAGVVVGPFIEEMNEECVCSLVLIGLIVFLVVGGCAPGPLVAPAEMERRSSANQPMEIPSASSGMAQSDTGRMIGYRELRIGDFRGERPPKAFVHRTPFFGAVTCIYLQVEPDLQIFSRPVKGGGDGVEYVADLEQIVFRALVDRGCSWWNQAAQGLSPQRVLQHEQIHFALFEIAARRLNGRMLAIPEKRWFRGTSAEGAKGAARRFIDHLIHETMQELDEQHTRFDQEVEGGRSWEQQQRWWRQVEAELLETAPYAAAKLMDQ